MSFCELVFSSSGLSELQLILGVKLKESMGGDYSVTYDCNLIAFEKAAVKTGTRFAITCSRLPSSK